MTTLAYRAGSAFIQIAPSFRGFHLQVAAEMKRVKNVTVNVNADADTTKATAQLDRVARDRDAHVNVKVRGTEGVNFAFRGVSNLSTAIAGLAPIAVPAFAAVAAGAGVLGSSLLTAGAAGGALGGVIAANVKEYKDLQKQMTADAKIVESRNKAVDSARASLAGATKGTASYAAAGARLKDALNAQKSAQGALNADLKMMNGEFGPLTRGLDNFKGGLGQLTHNTRPEVIGLMGHALNVVGGILPRLAPLVKATAVAVDGLVGEVERFSKTTRFQGILDFFTRLGPSAITSFAHSAGNLLMGVFNLFTAFAPQQQRFLGGFEAMTASFARWSAGFGKSNGFRDFMGYARKVLPDVRDLFIQLTEFVGKFIVALGPLAGVELKLVLLFLRGLNALPTKVLTALAVAITGIVLALKAWEVSTKAVTIANGLATARTWLFVGATNAETGAVNLSRAAKVRDRVATLASTVATKAATVASKAFAIGVRLVNLALRANPIGIVITLLTVLGAGFVLAYKKSDTFRKIVQAAWKGIREAASFAWNNVIRPIFRAYVAYLQNVLFPVVRFFYERVVRPVFNSVGDVIRWTWNRVIKPTFGAIRTAVGKVGDAFSSAVGGIKRVWTSLRDAVKGPVRFIVNTVYNKGILPFVNRLPFIPGDLQPIRGWATGGYTGRGGKYEPAGIVHRNEHVIRSESTESLNRRAPGFLDHLNKRGADALRGLLPGYWIGGGVKPAAGAVSRHGGYPWANWAGDINEPGNSDIGHPVHAWKAGVVAATNAWNYSYGHHIRVNHPGNERTLYAHLSRIMVRAGEHIARNQVIGLKGGTGNASGPHLHFEWSGGSNPIRGGRGGAPGGGAGAANPSSYGGPSVNEARKKLDPSQWLGALKGMGPWGGAFGGMIGGVVGGLRRVVVDKIRDAVAAARDVGGFLLRGGNSGRFAASAKGVWNALRAAGWNQAAAAGMLGNMQVESGFSPTIIQGGSHGTPAQAGSRGYGLVQWTPASKIARMLNGRAPTVGNEVAALTRELRGGYLGLSYRMQRTKSPVTAAMAFLREFERPANPNQPIRGVYATTWFNRFARNPAKHDQGGYIPPGLSAVYNGTSKPEAVFTTKQWADIHTLATRGADAGRGAPMVYIDKQYTSDPDAAARATRREQMKAVALMRLA